MKLAVNKLKSIFLKQAEGASEQLIQSPIL